MAVRTSIVRAWLNLNGVATPDGVHPTGRHVSILRAKVLGAATALIGLVTAYFFILRPIEEAKRIGVLHQGPFGLLMPMILLYCGVAMLVTDLRDEKTLRSGPQGRLLWTRKGRMASFVAAAATALVRSHLAITLPATSAVMTSDSPTCAFRLRFAQMAADHDVLMGRSCRSSPPSARASCDCQLPSTCLSPGAAW